MTNHTKRVEINLGYTCNAKCAFCYYYDSIVTKTNLETLTTQEAKIQLHQAKKLGIQEIEFTGGEVTLRKDLPELIAYAKNELSFRVISIITNGIRLFKRDYVKSLVDAGLDDMLISVHGHNAAVHDYVTKVPRSFEHIIEGIKYAHEFGIHVRTNTTVCKANYKHMKEMLRLLLDCRVDNINFVMFNPLQQAKNIDRRNEIYVSYAQAGKEIIRALDAYEDELPHFNVRYMPFCFLKGYEKYITNMDQMTFDPDEWDNFASFRIRKGSLKSWVSIIPGILTIPYLGYVLKHGLAATCTAGQSRFYVLKDRIKTKSCKQCSYEKVCDYIYRDYHDVYGDADVTAIEGEKISNPAWIMDAGKHRKPGERPVKQFDLEQYEQARPWSDERYWYKD